MLNKKQAGIAVLRRRAAPRPQNVANLMDALRRSMAQEKAASAPPNHKRIEGQRKLLLPVLGKKSKEPANKVAERSSTTQKKAG
jgi:DNA end-binding protein Ku